VWSPDGGRIAFAASQGKGRDFDLYWAASDGSSDPELFLRLGAWGARPTSFSPDGQTLVYCQESTAGDPAGLQDGRIDLFAVPTQGERKPTPLLKSSFSVSYGVFSPDGRWIAYVSFESGERQVYVRAARGDGRKWAVSSGRGFGPAWAPSGRELFYQDRNTLMVVPVSTSGAGFEAGTPRKLLDIAFNVQYDMGRPYDPGSDGQRFLVLQARVSFRPEIPLRLGLIPDWLQEVEARVRSAAAR
jgi:Tol biopolymer transport system component